MHHTIYQTIAIAFSTKTEGGRWKIEMHFCRESVQKLLFVSVTQPSGSLIPVRITRTEDPLMEQRSVATSSLSK